MRRKDKEIKEKTAMEAILHQAPVLHLAMCDQGRPYVLPLSFGYKDDHLYIHCAKEGRKLEVLRANPRVCFETAVDLELKGPEKPGEACGFTMLYRSVVGEGSAEIIEDPEEVRRGLDIIMEHYSDGPFNYREKTLGHVYLIRITVESLSGKQST